MPYFLKGTNIEKFSIRNSKAASYKIGVFCTYIFGDEDLNAI